MSNRIQTLNDSFGSDRKRERALSLPGLAVASLLLGLVAMVGQTLWPAAVAQQNAKGPRLPGARAVIHAEEFPSLQAALDAAPAAGGVIVLPPGDFEIHEPLVLSRGDVLLQGAGAATHIINKNTSGEPALRIQHPKGKEVARDDRLWRVMLSNFRITGNPKSGHGIEAILIEEIFLQGVTVSYHGGDGVRLDHCYEDPRVSDCLFTYNKQVGLNLIGCHDIVVCANQFEENNDAVHCIDGYNLCMNGNCVDDHLQHGVVIENTYGSVVAGNMIEECNQAALIMDRDCYGNTVSANVIAHNGAGVLLRDAHGCAISANTFTILKTKSVHVGPKSGRITVSANNFANSFIGGDQVKRRKNDLAAAGILLEGSDVSLTGNVFASVEPGIQVNGSQRVAMVGNVLTEVKSEQDNLSESVTSDNVIGDANKTDDN